MNKRALFWGGALILLGLLILLDNLGVFESLGVSLWGLILPALLILIGVWLIWSIFTRQKNPQSEQVTIPDDDIQRAELVINHGAGRLFISADPSQFNLIEGSFDGGVEQDTQLNAGTLRVKLTMVSDFFGKFPEFGHHNRVWIGKYDLNRQLDMYLC